jgi:hypothetical protein
VVELAKSSAKAVMNLMAMVSDFENSVFLVKFETPDEGKALYGWMPITWEHSTLSPRQPGETEIVPRVCNSQTVHLVFNASVINTSDHQKSTWSPTHLAAEVSWPNIGINCGWRIHDPIRKDTQRFPRSKTDYSVGDAK